MTHRNIIHLHARLRSGAGYHKIQKHTNWKEEIDMRLSLQQFKAEHGIHNGTDMMNALEEWSSDSVVPAMCQDGCEVEPDGHCEHGCPSILVRMGVI